MTGDVVIFWDSTDSWNLPQLTIIDGSGSRHIYLTRVDREAQVEQDVAGG
jgi:hypothetical protein